MSLPSPRSVRLVKKRKGKLIESREATQLVYLPHKRLISRLNRLRSFLVLFEPFKLDHLKRLPNHYNPFMHFVKERYQEDKVLAKRCTIEFEWRSNDKWVILNEN